MNVRKAIVLTVLFAVVSTAMFYFRFGSRSQVSELPIIQRFEDPGYLENDFYVNAASDYGPRYFYAKFVAAVSTKKSLPYICYLLTLLINIFTGIVTFYFAFDIFDRSILAGLLAVGLVLSVETFLLGYFPNLYARQLLSSSLVFPFILLALWAAVRQFPFLWAVSGGVAALIHPTFGIEGGVIALMVMVLSGTLRYKGKISSYIKESGKFTAAAMLLFFLFAAIPVIINLGMPHIDSLQYIEIETKFRHPHHNLFSHLKGLFKGICFFIAAGFAWSFWYKKNKINNRHLPLTILVVAIFIFILCGLGLVFVEVFPMRFWAVARPFRLLFILKWLGLILIAGRIAEFFSRSSRGTSMIKPYIFLISVLSPPTTALFFITGMAEEKNISRYPVFRVLLNPWILLTGILSCLIFFWAPPFKNAFLLIILCFLSYFLVYNRKIRFINPVSIFLVLLLSAPLIRYTPLGPKLPQRLDSFLNHLYPDILYSDGQSDFHQVSRFVRNKTKKNSMFLIPPTLGGFRLMADRAVVVNWKSFPFQELAAVEWKKRILSCYGPLNSIGHTARDEMTENYKKIDDIKIKELKTKYGFSHSVLFNKTKTNFPVIYENKKYKVVLLN